MALQKIGFDYFPVSVDLSNDPKIYFLLELTGCKGLGIWTLLLTDIYRAGGWIRWGNIEGRMFAKRFGMTQEELNDVINALVQAQMFSPRLLKLGYLSSRGIQNRIRTMCAMTRRKPPVFPQDVEILNEEDTFLGEETKEHKTKEDQTKVNKSALHNAEELQHNVVITPHNAEESRRMPKAAEEYTLPANIPAPLIEALGMWRKLQLQKYRRTVSQMEVDALLMEWSPRFGELRDAVLYSTANGWKNVRAKDTPQNGHYGAKPIEAPRPQPKEFVPPVKEPAPSPEARERIRAMVAAVAERKTSA